MRGPVCKSVGQGKEQRTTLICCLYRDILDFRVRAGAAVSTVRRAVTKRTAESALGEIRLQQLGGEAPRYSEL